MTNNENQFITFFENCKFRYLDLTGNSRAPISSDIQRDDLNKQGYCAFFTPNGFEGATATKDNCINLNAFYIDIDQELSEDDIDNIKNILDPTFITRTMHGFHIYWLLDEPIFKAETENWDEVVLRWEAIEQSIVNTIPNADKAVKDIPRILRLPGSLYWKKTNNKYKEGVATGVFKIKGIYKQVAHTYSMNEVEEVFPIKELATIDYTPTVKTDKAKRMADAEKADFFERVNAEFPFEERDSFIRLISNTPDSLPADFGRNNALHVTASLMRQAGWSVQKALTHIEKVGWHGMEKEPAGLKEIQTTIKNALKNSYTYSHHHELISYNMSPVENQKIQQAYTKVIKARKEQDKVRFSNYERELLSAHPYIKKNEIGMVFEYHEGVYKMLSDLEVSDMVLNGLYEDMLWGYRTKKNVSDKVACLLSIIPPLVISDDKGYIANVKNGLLNIYTKELKPHTPDFISLIQYPVEYDPKATCPTWDKCMIEWMEGEEAEEKTRLLQQFSGYCLSSSMLYDKALFMVGDGGNGKSTFIDTIAMVIGDKATSNLDLDTLYGQFGFHGLIGKRLNIIEEVSGNFYQANKLKKLISGEQVTIDVKYKAQFKFRPQAKFVFSVNIFPRVDDTTTATERRICCLQFLNNWRDNPNPKLRSDVGLLAKELPGILNWMVEGAIDLANAGSFVITDEQTKMLDEYRAENSSVEGFIVSCIVLSEFSSITTTELYEEYRQWSSTDGGRKTKANITFTKEMKAYGAKKHRFKFEPRSSSKGEARFVGIMLNPLWTERNKEGSGLQNDNNKGWHK